MLTATKARARKAARTLAATFIATAALVPLVATPAAGDPRVGGEIGRVYEAHYGGAGGLLGNPLTPERRTPNGVGAYVHFERGSIYWSHATGAWEVHGAIREEWAYRGWETSFVGFPVSGENPTPRRHGAYNHFQRGSIYWSPEWGAWPVFGAIGQAWAGQGWENGCLGFPISEELALDSEPGLVQEFEGGVIAWAPQGRVVIHPWPNDPELVELGLYPRC